jgi:hypothetical protein
VPDLRITNVDFQEDRSGSKVPNVRARYEDFLVKFAQLKDDQKASLIFSLGGIHSDFQSVTGEKEWRLLFEAIKTQGRAIVRPQKQEAVYGKTPNFQEFAEFASRYGMILEKVFRLEEAKKEPYILVLSKSPLAGARLAKPPLKSRQEAILRALGVEQNSIISMISRWP